MPQKINIGIVGASGLVGRTMLDVLLERSFPANRIKLLASSRSAGKEVIAYNQRFIIEELNEHSFEGLDVALFSAGAYVSEQYAPIAVISDCVAIDNGSFWRMNKQVPLVVPEVNSISLHSHSGIICNPNCSTIQLVVVLYALSQLCDISRVVVSTYQSVSGGGQKLLDKFHAEISDRDNTFKHEIFNSIMFHSEFNSAGNTNEEEKMHQETRKILALPNLNINATCVRVPIENSHSEAVNIEFASKVKLNQIKEKLSNTRGIVFVDGNNYPTPLVATGSDDIFVGRLRQDTSNEKAVNLWIVSDNLRKGAATNATQIAEYVVANSLFIRA